MIKLSQEIIKKAEMDFNPYAKVLMFSGGNDSLAALYTCLKLNIELDFIIHINTGTGIQETTDFVRNLSSNLNISYLEGNAQDSYQNYIFRKGFFGRGRTAHSYAYHILKATEFRKVISRNIRKRKRNRPILLINGARKQESENRKHNLTEYFNIDPAGKNNIWTNIIHDWSKMDCIEFIDSCNAPVNPVTTVLHRSGECMCGTMQSLEDRKEASFWFPKWGKWLDDIEKNAIEKSKCPWKWGENIPKWWSARKKAINNGQIEMFSPMCQDCIHSEK